MKPAVDSKRIAIVEVVDAALEVLSEEDEGVEPLVRVESFWRKKLAMQGCKSVSQPVGLVVPFLYVECRHFGFKAEMLGVLWAVEINKLE